MDDMQAVYDEELGRGRGGLMSLLRGMGDFTVGEDVMNNLPEIIAMLRNTNKDTLTMRQTQEMGKPSELAVTLSNTPGLESLLGEELGMAMRMVGSGKKVGMAKEGLESFLKMRDELMDERATRFFEGPAGEKAMKIDRRMIQRMMDEDPKVGPRGEFNRRLEEGEMSEEYERALREYQDFMNRQGESGIQKLRKDIFSDPEELAGGGRPGLYANIAAKRRRIAAGSGEKMRKPGSKGAPTKENFRQAETTAKKANGGGLSYAKGYYGKSYK